MSKHAASEHVSRRRWVVAAMALAVLAPILAACEPPVPSTSAVYDAFERPDSAGLGTAQTGQVWTTHSGSPALVGGDAALGSGAAITSVQSNRSNGVASTLMATLGNEFWLVLRMSNDQNYWRFGSGNGGAYVLQQIQGNQIGGAAVESLATVIPQALDRLSCRLNNSSISCSVDGVLIARTTDGFNATATRHGLSTWQSPETRFEEFRVGELVTMPDLVASMTVPGQVQIGTQIVATGTLSNIGLAPVSSATATWHLPAGVTSFSGTSPAGICSTSGQTVVCPVGALGVDQSRTVTMTVTAPSTAGPLALLLVGSHAAADEQSANSVDSGNVTVTDTPPLSVVFDPFDRPNGPGLGAAVTGQPWTTHYGSAAIVNQQAALGGTYGMVSVESARANGDVATTVPETGTDFLMIMRMSDDSNYWRFGRLDDGVYVLQKIQGNQVGSAQLEELASITPEAGDRLSCRLTSTTIACSVDGVLVVRTGDAFNRTATRHGLSQWQSPQVRFDDFTVAELPVGPDLLVAFSGTRAVEVGGPVQLTGTVVNTGSSTATAAVLDGMAPAGATGLQVNTSDGTCTVTGAAFHCQLGDLAAGSSESVSIEWTAPVTAGPVTTSVQASHSGVDADPSNDHATVTTTVRLPTPLGAAVRDDFNRPTGSDLGVTDTGETWTIRHGGFRIVDGQAAPTAPYSFASVDSGFSFGTYDLVLAAGADSPFYIALRVVDADNYYRLTTSSVGTYRLEKIVNGAVEQMYANFERAAVQAQNGDAIRIVLRADDGIFVFVNGEHIIDSGDVQFMNATGFGFVTYSTAPRFDDLFISSVAQGLPVSDTFTRPDDPMSLGTPEEGIRLPWRVWFGDFWGVDGGGAAHAGSAGYGMAAVEASTEAAGVRARFTTLGSEQWIVFRHAESGSYFRFGAARGGQYVVQFVNGSSVTVPAGIEMVNPTTVATGDLVQVVQFVDGRVEAYVNGVMTLRFSDTATNRRATSYGLATLGDQARFDDFAVTLPAI